MSAMPHDGSQSGQLTYRDGRLDSRVQHRIHDGRSFSDAKRARGVAAHNDA